MHAILQEENGTDITPRKRNLVKKLHKKSWEGT
jgi:hypothetical protein